MNSRAQYSPAMLQRPVVELVIASGNSSSEVVIVPAGRMPTLPRGER